MSLLPVWVRCVMAALLCLGVNGCFPSGSNPLDEQKEPHFLTGKARVNAMDYKGAIEAFEKALEVNPRSASAHFELGLLYEKNEMDYAATIYHFDRFLRLRPDSAYAEIVKQRTIACKQELARSVSLAPVTQVMQRDWERLATENRELRQKLESWQAYYANQLAAPGNRPGMAPSQTLAPGAPASTQPTAPRSLTNPPLNQAATARPTAATATRTHTVKSGDSPYAIAKQYGVKLDALLAANPRVDPRKLQVGQAVNIPRPVTPAMLPRLAFLLIATFWVTMNVLLWREEFGRRESGSPVLLEIVWRKMLSAPDNSLLEVFQHGRKIGFCRWAPNVGEEPAVGGISTAEVPLEGMVRRPTGYQLNFEGNVAVGDFANRLRFDLSLDFANNQEWQRFHLRLHLRPFVWELDSVASAQALRLRMEDENGQRERVFSFANLQDLLVSLREWGGPLPLALLSTAGFPADAQKVSPVRLGLNWEARRDWFQIGHSPVRVYRLETRVLDRFPIVVIISRVGEILRVELPDETVLINDQLSW